MLGLLLIILAVTAGYLFEKVRKEETPFVQAPVNVGVREIVVRPVDNVQKSIGQLDGRKVITYIIEGSFDGPLTKSAFWGMGEFVIKGDVKERKVKTYFGMADGNTVLGKYTGSFRGDSTWTPVPTDDALLELDGVPVIMYAQYLLDENPQNLQKVARDESIMDAYIDAMQTGRYDSDIPPESSQGISKTPRKLSRRLNGIFTRSNRLHTRRPDNNPIRQHAEIIPPSFPQVSPSATN